MAKRKSELSELSKSYEENREAEELKQFQQAIWRIQFDKDSLLEAGFHPVSIRMGEDLYRLLNDHHDERAVRKRTDIIKICDLDIIKDGDLQNHAQFVIESAEYIAAKEENAG